MNSIYSFLYFTFFQKESNQRNQLSLRIYDSDWIVTTTIQSNNYSYITTYIRIYGGDLRHLIKNTTIYYQ